MQKHFVEFLSPGTFVSEHSTREIDSWDTAKAAEMAKTITERHASHPYGFRFITRSRGPDDFDSKETARSGFYYIEGKVETIEDVRNRADPKERILLENMECNGWHRIVTCYTPYIWTQPLYENDVVLKEL